MKNKLQKCVFLLLLTVSLFISVQAKENIDPLLVDEFGKIACGDLLARTDAFFVEIGRREDMVGLVIIYPQKDSRNDGKNYYLRIHANAELRLFDQKRWSIETAEPTSDLKVQFWLLPKDAPKLDIDTTLWQPKAFDLSKPALIGTEDENGVCPTFVPRIYAELLLENPSSRAKIIVHGGDKHSRRSFSEAQIEEFVEKYNVPRNQIDIEYRKAKDITRGEFWIIPPKQVKNPKKKI